MLSLAAMVSLLCASILIGALLIRQKTLQSRLKTRKKIKIDGVLFEIKKIDVFDYLHGSNVLKREYETYNVNAQKDATSVELETSLNKKIKKHYRDVLMAGVVSPELSLKAESEKVCVDELMDDFVLAQKVYQEIIDFTFHKKKAYF